MLEEYIDGNSLRELLEERKEEREEEDGKIYDGMMGDYVDEIENLRLIQQCENE